jgi:ABC-type sugar transport system substrate-binding protein
MSFVPPRPSELTDAAVKTSSSPSPSVSNRAAGTSDTGRSTTAPRARLVALILSQPPNFDRLYLEQFLRRDSGTKKCAFRSVKPETNEPMSPARLAQAIRSLVEHGAGALIVEAIDGPEVQASLREAESAGTAIVLLDSPLPSSSPGKTRPYVTMKGFAEAGKEIVETAIEEASSYHLPADGTILVVQSSQQDNHSKERLESITSALKASGRPYEILAFSGDQPAGMNLILAYVTSHPRVTIILADEDYGLSAGYQVRRKLAEETNRHVIVGGYGANDTRLDILVKNAVSVLADRNVEGYSRKALQLALDQMDGKPVPERLEVDMPVTHNRPASYPAAAEPKKSDQKSEPGSAVGKASQPPAPQSGSVKK